MATQAAPEPWPRRAVLLAGAAVYLASFVLLLPRLLAPTLWYDDWAYLRDSWTWALTRQNLWLPFNEHAMPLARLSTWLLVTLAGDVTNLPWVLGLQGPVAVWVGMALVYTILRRELGHPVYGLIGMALFGVSTQYYEAVWWYSATFGLLAVDTSLAALLAAQCARQTGRRRYLLGCALGCALAPGWYGGGILAGPLCALYLLWPAPGRRWGPAVAEALAPLLGSAAFLACSLPRTLGSVLRPNHFEGQTVAENFHPGAALLYVGRSVVDNLCGGTVGLSVGPCPLWLAAPALAATVAAGVVWWRLAPHRRLLAVGLFCVFASYALIYGARSSWSYEQIWNWSRYQTFAHPGLVFFLVGGLPRWGAALRRPRPRAGLLALAALLLTQLPRTTSHVHEPGQRAQLRRVAEVDALCRRHHISAAQAREALDPWILAGGSKQDNAWRLLRGSDDPRPRDPAEVRALLTPP